MGGSSRHGRTNVYIKSNRTKDMMSREEVVEAAKEALPDIPGVEMRVGWGGSRGGEAPQLQLTLRGEETATLENVALEVRRVLSAVPGVIGVSADEEEEGDEEIRLVIDRKETARYGLSAERIGRLVSFALRRNSLSPMRQGVAEEQGSGGGDAGREVEVVARYRYEDREDLDRLLDFPMWSPTKQAVVPLRAVVQPEVAPALDSIHRRDRQTVFPLTIDIENDAQESVVWADISAALANVAFPRGYDWDDRSRFEKQQQEDDARNMALLLSVVFVFLIMGVLFESLLLPVSIISTIPLALLGVYWVLFLTGTPLDAMGGVGLVVLVGVVVNNGIVLIDLVTQLRAEGVDRASALVQAGERRLRPILMTALTTVFGLLPMAVGSSAFIGMPYAPLGRVVAGGLVAGTLLTLFFVPFMYSVLDDMRMSGSRWRAGITRQPVGSK